MSACLDSDFAHALSNADMYFSRVRFATRFAVHFLAKNSHDFHARATYRKLIPEINEFIAFSLSHVLADDDASISSSLTYVDRVIIE